MQLLLKHGAEINLQDANGRTALHYSCERQKIDAVKLLLDAGAQTNIVDNGGFTELHLAAHSHRDTDLKVKHLIKSHSYPAQVVIEAYETLPWFLLRESDAYEGKLDKVIDSMTKATRMREEYNLPKKVCDPLECYGFVKEWETIEEVLKYKNSREQLMLQATLSVERIYRKGRPTVYPFREDIEHHGLYKILAFNIFFLEKY